jgi:hypothetical protein
VTGDARHPIKVRIIAGDAGQDLRLHGRNNEGIASE